jgi:hypothetical protein
MKHILIPTDFSLRSLNIVRYAVDYFQHEKLRVTMLHFLEMPDSISDLLLMPRDTSFFKLETPEFREGKSILLNRFANQIAEVRTDFFVGDSKRQFKNYLEHQKIEKIVQPQNYEINLISKRSYDPAKLIWRTGWPVQYIDIPYPSIISAEAGISELLLATA